ncbi:hypothetical protein GCM10009533_23920 [Saccharopolyspora spinosporotrichia]|uniref:Uncharacterized protein n=1 Tax=Saccharopolyspora erythraea TaxID=1836 RepID=A0ABN1CQN0_SACER
MSCCSGPRGGDGPRDSAAVRGAERRGVHDAERRATEVRDAEGCDAEFWATAGGVTAGGVTAGRDMTDSDMAGGATAGTYGKPVIFAHESTFPAVQATFKEIHSNKRSILSASAHFPPRGKNSPAHGSAEPGCGRLVAC